MSGDERRTEGRVVTAPTWRRSPDGILHATPPQPARRPRFYTANEVATLLRVSKMTVYRMVERGELYGVRVGRSLRVSVASVERLIGGAA